MPDRDTDEIIRQKELRAQLQAVRSHLEEIRTELDETEKAEKAILSEIVLEVSVCSACQGARVVTKQHGKSSYDAPCDGCGGVGVIRETL